MEKAQHRGQLLRNHMIRLVVKFVQDQLRKNVEIFYKQALMLNMESTVIFMMDELIDSILEPKSYK